MQTASVVVIDDDNDIREAVCDSLRDEGYTVEGFSSGEAAIAKLREGPAPMLILLDWMMPNMDGGKVSEALRKEPRLALVPVVLLTADVHAKEKASRLGLPGYLRKPLQLEELLRVVSIYAGAPHPA